MTRATPTILILSLSKDDLHCAPCWRLALRQTQGEDAVGVSGIDSDSSTQTPDRVATLAIAENT